LGDGNAKGRHRILYHVGTYFHYQIHPYTPSWRDFLSWVFTRLKLNLCSCNLCWCKFRRRTEASWLELLRSG